MGGIGINTMVGVWARRRVTYGAPISVMRVTWPQHRDTTRLRLLCHLRCDLCPAEIGAVSVRRMERVLW